MEFFQSKAGIPSAKIGQTLIHSSYDPIKEAQRFLFSHLKENPSCVILIGSGMGYLDDLIVQQFPSIKLLSLHLDRLFLDKRGDFSTQQMPNTHYWFADQGVLLEQFLSQSLTEIDLEGMDIIFWNPMIQANPGYDNILKTVKFFIKRLESSFYSLGYFGFRWVNNAIANFLSCEYTGELPQVENVVIAASGPTLEASLSDLKKYRDHYYLIALPSSLCCLEASGITPDLAIITDGGHYAKAHLTWLDTSIPLAMPLIASYDHIHPKMLFSFGTFFEDMLLSGMNTPRFSWNGTVAGNAMILASQIAGGKIILAGQDFCSQGLHLHASPHTFSSIYEEQSHRMKPLIAHYQEAVWQSQSSLDVYANWFKSYPDAHRIYRVHPSKVELPFKDIQLSSLKKSPVLNQKMAHINQVALPSLSQRKERVISLINHLEDIVSHIESPTQNEEEILLYFDALKYYQYKKARRLKENIGEKKKVLQEHIQRKVRSLKEKYC